MLKKIELPSSSKTYNYNIGVDNNNFYPVSFDELVEIMKNQPDNFNLIKKEKTNEQRKC